MTITPITPTTTTTTTQTAMSTAQPPTSPTLPTASSTMPPTESLAALMGRTLPERIWTVEGLLAPGLTLLAGKPKTGKSWLLLGWALAVASGQPALGVRPVTPGRVLYLALEDTRERLQARVRKLWDTQRDGPYPEAVELAYSWERLDQGGAERLERDLAAHPETRLALIDTFAKVRSVGRSRGKAAYERDYFEMGQLKHLAERYQVALVVCHHERKAKGRSEIDTVSGTTGLTGAADATLILRRDRQRDQATLYVTGRDHLEGELRLRWRDDSCAWTEEDGDEEGGAAGAAENSSVRLSAQQRAVLAILRARSPQFPCAVSAALGVSQDSGRHIIERMTRRGLLVSTPAGYMLAQEAA